MSSKRLCISLLHAPSRSSPHLLRRCPLQTIFTVLRDDTKPQRRTTHHRRPFTTSSSHNIGSARQIRSVKSPSSGPSMAVMLKGQQQRMQDSGALLDHVGIIEGTFVPPTGTNLPSLLSDTRGRLKLEWRRLRQSLLDTGRNAFQRFWLISPRPKLGKKEAPQVARDLYEGMNAHFARGDLSPVETTLAPGLVASLRGRIAQRTVNTSLLWTLHDYISPPTVVSHKLAIMSTESRNNKEQMGMEQCVVRIRSRQSLLKLKKIKVGSVVETVPVTENGDRIRESWIERVKQRLSKETTEYVVVQRHMKRSTLGPWQLWGTAEETTLERLERQEKKHDEAMLRIPRTRGA